MKHNVLDFVSPIPLGITTNNRLCFKPLDIAKTSHIDVKT